MIRINLIPAPERREVKGIGDVLIGICVLIAFFVVIAAIHIVQERKLEDVNRGIAKAEKRIKALEIVKQKVDDFKAKNAELNRRIEIIDVLEKNRTGPLYVMDALSHAVPNKAWIDEFTGEGFSDQARRRCGQRIYCCGFHAGPSIFSVFRRCGTGSNQKNGAAQARLEGFVINTSSIMPESRKRRIRVRTPQSPRKNPGQRRR